MSRIEKAFKNGKEWIPFITGGDPTLDVTEQLIYTMEEAGADLIEIGIPFSDPVAEGAVVQEANGRALAAGCTTDLLFELAARVRTRSEIPLVFVTYMNPIYTYGKDAFMKKCREVGVDGVIVQDLPYEEKEEILSECRKYGVDLISLIAPASDERLTMIAEEAMGFVCFVSTVDTEKRDGIDMARMVRLIREKSSLPCVVESEGMLAQETVSASDGVIMGSSVEELIAAYGADSVKPVADYVRKMKKTAASAQS